MAATVFAGEGATARGGCSAECAGGTERPPDLGSRARPAGDGCAKRSVYLMECVPLWGCAATRGHAAEMEDACAAVPRFADVPVRMLASSRELDGIGVDFDAAELRLPAHLFGVYDGHGGSEVANYCRDKIHVVLRDVLRAGKGLREVGEVDVKEPWEKVFGDCFQKVDDEVSGKSSMSSNGFTVEPIAADKVGSTAVVVVVCSSHVITANCGDSRAVLCRGKEPIALSIDHKPDRKDERARIEATGGKVIDWNGYRVSGILAMSRSIDITLAGVMGRRNLNLGNSTHSKAPTMPTQFWMSLLLMMFLYPSYCRPNIWPDDHLPELEIAFKALGKLMLEVGLMLAHHCDLYVMQHGVEPYDGESLEQTISRSRCHKGRLLYYFPRQLSTQKEGGSVSSWCGWHTDHGSLTGLTCGLFMRNSVEIPCPDSAAGLYIRTRDNQVVKVTFGEDELAYQIGETTEILSRGRLCATPHCVQAPSSENASNVERSTFAMFMQPDWNETLKFPSEIPYHQELIPPNGALTFGEYSEKLVNKYYQGKT